MEASALIAREADSAYALVAGRSITSAEFCADVEHCAAGLPDATYVINLCADRYRFSVGFFAAAARGQTNLLPTKRDRQTVDLLRREFPDVCVLTDQAQQAQAREQPGDADYLLTLEPGQQGTAASPTVALDAVTALAFTSGSTGQPQSHAKPWGLLAEARGVHACALGPQGHAERNSTSGLVATVPSWHMYGLEWALLLPTIAPLTLFCGNDFFPRDVHAALSSFEKDTVLVSTPVHLKALLKSAAPKMTTGTTVCATAPLDQPQAARIEQHLNTRLLEVYGCSEVGSLATRATAQQHSWQFFDNFALALSGQSLTVSSPLLPGSVELGDQFAQADDGRFDLLGRATDIVKVAGKRESLAHLNHIVQSISGVDDAVFYQPEQLGLDHSGRLGLLVVAPDLPLTALKQQLARQLDHAFMPRPIHRVASLPREPSSKLPQSALTELVATMNGVGTARDQ